MADIRIRQLPDGGGPVATDYLPIDNGSTRKATIQNVVEIGRPAASQAEAEAGTNPSKVMTPLTTKQAVDFYGLTKAGNLAGLADLPTARSNLGVAIGSNVQAYDAALESISGLTTSADQMLYTTGSDAYATTALTPFARTILDDANAAAAQSTLGLVIGTNVQAFDVDLAAIAALTSAADKLPYATGAGTWAMADFTAAGRALLDDADATAQRATLGLGTAAVKNTGTSIGDVVMREDYQGQRGIYTDSGQTVFARRTVGLSDAVDWHFIRVQNVAGADTTFGFVNSNLKASSIVSATSDRSEWAITGVIQVDAPSNNAQHVGAYFQGLKNADANTWSLATEMRDLVANPTKGSIAFENGMFVAGLDNNNQRVVLHIPIDRHSSQTGTNHWVGRGIWITPDSGNLTVKWGIELKGQFTVGIDLSGVNVAISDSTITMGQNQFIKFLNGYHGSEVAAFGWNSTQQTWVMNGLKLTSAAVTGGIAPALPANPATYFNIHVGGTTWKLPAYS